MTAPKIGERHRECAREVSDDVMEHISNPHWDDHSTEIIAKHFPEDDSAKGIEALVCNDIADRQKLGLNKYGVSVADNPGDLEYWLTHAYQETLDKAVYLRRAIEEIRKQKAADDSWVERAAEEIAKIPCILIDAEDIARIINGCRRG